MTFSEFKSKYEKVPVVIYPSKVVKQPVVSVCVQTYQHADYIRECLDGILTQETNFEFEILLGEDNSTDGTREICLEYAEKYPDKIRLFLHRRENNIKVNRSPTGRFNFLYNIYSSQGKYIALCEGDDYWTDPLKLQKQVSFMEENEEYSYSYHLVKVNRNGIETEEIKNIREANMSNPHTSAILFRNKLEYPIEMIDASGGDNFIYYLLSKKGKRAYQREIKHNYYRIHPGGVISMKSKRERGLMREKSLLALLRYAYRKGYKEDCKSFFKILILYLLKRGVVFDFSSNFFSTFLSAISIRCFVFVDKNKDGN